MATDLGNGRQTAISGHAISEDAMGGRAGPPLLSGIRAPLRWHNSGFGLRRAIKLTTYS